MARTVTVSYSELDAFRQCPLKHRLGYLERWSPAETSIALSRGTAWHAMMEAHYRTLKMAQDSAHPQHEWRSDPRLEQQLRLTCEMHAHKALLDLGMSAENDQLLEWMYAGYVKQWGLDRTWIVLAVEHNAVVPLWERNGNKSRFRVKVKIDLIVARLDLVGTPTVIVDHKSGGRLPTSKELDIDDQFGIYEAAYARLGKPILGSLHNANRTQRNQGPMALTDRLGRYSMARGLHECDELMFDALRAAKASRSAANLAEPYSSPNPDQCKWKCDFLQVHMAARKGGDIRQILTGMGFTQNFERH